MMMLPILAVDKDESIVAREKTAWEKRGIASVHVTSMQEAIKLLDKDDYIFVAINADNIDYLPHLRIMRDTTPAPIFVIGSAFSTAKEVEAISNGADSYDIWRETTDDNIESALAALHKHTERADQRKKSIKILYHGSIMLVLDYYKAFINDTELHLTKAEFDILHCLIRNRGRVMTYSQIYDDVYRYDYDEDPTGILFSAMKRLKKKLRETAGTDAYIENIRGVGYRASL